MLNQIRRCADLRIHHFHTAAVHSLIDDRAPALQIIARKKMNMALFHHIPDFIRFLIAIEYKFPRQPATAYLLPNILLQFSAPKHMHPEIIAFFLQAFCKHYHIFRVF